MDDYLEYELAENCTPIIENGTYQVSVEVDGDILGQSEKLTQKFSVEGPRFSLSDQILAVYPGNGVAGHFGRNLPYVLLRRRTLPWERKMNTENVIPWVWLLVLTEDEIMDVQTGVVQEVISSGQNLQTPKLSLDDQEKSQACNYIDMDNKMFLSMAPTEKELSWLCHGRSLSAQDKAENNGVDMDWVSCVLSNRLPGTGDALVKNKAYLVSLEGCERYWTEGSRQKGGKVRLLVLHHWEFYSQTTDDNHFYKLISGLKMDVLTRDVKEGSKQYQDILGNGYVPMQHCMRDGSRTVSFYRGPCVPKQVQNSTTERPLLCCADSLYRYDPSLGVFDVSYAVAWQLGRLLVLGNDSILQELLDQREQCKKVLQENYLEGRKELGQKRAADWLMSILVRKGDDIL